MVMLGPSSPVHAPEEMRATGRVEQTALSARPAPWITASDPHVQDCRWAQLHKRELTAVGRPDSAGGLLLLQRRQLPSRDPEPHLVMGLWTSTMRMEDVRTVRAATARGEKG